MAAPRSNPLRRVLLFALILFALVLLAILVAVWAGGGSAELPFRYGGFD